MSFRSFSAASFRPFVLAGLVALPALGAHAKTFKTEFVRFELPPNWSCRQEELDWTCQPDNLSERSEAIIIVVVKAINEVDDTWGKYEEVLKTPRAMRDLLGNAYQSQVKYVRTRQIRGHQWMDALSLGSEIPGFYTRNVVSIKEKVAGLVSYSVAESVYPKYATLMDQMLETLEISFDPKAFNDLMKSSPGSLLRPGKGAGWKAPTVAGDAKKDGAAGDGAKALGGLALLGAIVGYVIWKRKQKG